MSTKNAKVKSDLNCNNWVAAAKCSIIICLACLLLIIAFGGSFAAAAQSDTTDTKAPIFGPLTRAFSVSERYLVIPIKNGVKKCELTVSVEGKPVRRYSTELATNPVDVDWYAFFTMEEYLGKAASVSVNSASEDVFSLIRQADKVPGSETWYSEPLRPQFHFSQKVGWNNDTNGMIYYKGEWHLFFQHNPVGWKWGNMTWGHAISKDLIYWQQQPDKLFPWTMAKAMCYSGSAIVDKMNTAGFKTGKEDVIVAVLTDTGAGEAIAYSNDRGRAFTWYEGNPVVKHKGKDPKVIWYAYNPDEQPLNESAKQLRGHWVMATVVELDKKRRNIAFYTSTDLKNWTVQSYLNDHYHDCPEIFELPIDNDNTKKKWVVFGGDAKYVVGSFDGRTFTPEHEAKYQVHYGKYYASQTFNNAPDSRRIQMGWVMIDMPGMPFNQTFTFPHELTLRTTDDGVRMFAEPIKEIEKLHKKAYSEQNKVLADGSGVDLAVSGQLFDIRATFEVGSASQIGLQIGDERVVYDAKANTLDGATLKPIDGKVTLQVLVDRPMMEVIGNHGRVFITKPRQPGEVSSIQVFANGGNAKLITLEVFELNSIWK